MRKLSRAQIAEMQRLRLSRGRVHAPDVVEFATDPSTALHAFFEWDDTEAARLHRLAQAREVISLTLIVLVENHKPVRAFVSLSSDRTTGGGYRRMADVLSDEDLRAILLEDALAEIRLLRDKYSGLLELTKLWQEADRVEKSKTRKRRRQAA